MREQRFEAGKVHGNVPAVLKPRHGAFGLAIRDRVDPRNDGRALLRRHRQDHASQKSVDERRLTGLEFADYGHPKDTTAARDTALLAPFRRARYDRPGAPSPRSTQGGAQSRSPHFFRMSTESSGHRVVLPTRISTARRHSSLRSRRHFATPGRRSSPPYPIRQLGRGNRAVPTRATSRNRISLFHSRLRATADIDRSGRLAKGTLPVAMVRRKVPDLRGAARRRLEWRPGGRKWWNFRRFLVRNRGERRLRTVRNDPRETHRWVSHG